MLLQYEELLLKRRHPDYRPLSLDWNHKLLPRSASVRLCECVYVSVRMYNEQRPRRCRHEWNTRWRLVFHLIQMFPLVPV